MKFLGISLVLLLASKADCKLVIKPAGQFESLQTHLTHAQPAVTPIPSINPTPKPSPNTNTAPASSPTINPASTTHPKIKPTTMAQQVSVKPVSVTLLQTSVKANDSHKHSNKVHGKGNNVDGKDNTINGENNSVKGEGNFVGGSNSAPLNTELPKFAFNKIDDNKHRNRHHDSGKWQKLNHIKGKWNKVNGQGNIIKGQKNFVHGSGNIIASGGDEMPQFNLNQLFKNQMPNSGPSISNFKRHQQKQAEVYYGKDSFYNNLPSQFRQFKTKQPLSYNISPQVHPYPLSHQPRMQPYQSQQVYPQPQVSTSQQHPQPQVSPQKPQPHISKQQHSQPQHQPLQQSQTLKPNTVQIYGVVYDIVQIPGQNPILVPSLNTKSSQQIPASHQATVVTPKAQVPIQNHKVASTPSQNPTL